MKLYEKLRNLREEYGYTQQEVASKIEIGYSTYRKYENGTVPPKLEAIERIAGLYNVSMDELMEQKAGHPVGRCIICRRKMDDSNPASKEHIIPESWGNHSFVTYRVCMECNNRLGSKVDSGMLDNIFSNMARNIYDLPGKGGKLPRIFNHLEKEPAGKEYLIEDDDIQIKPMVKELEPGHFRINAPDVETAEKEIRKKLSRLNYSPEQIDDAIANWKVGDKIREQPVIKKDFAIDSDKLCVAAAKIVYEAACEILPAGYLSDPIAIQISNLLQAAMDDGNITSVRKIVAHDKFNIAEMMKDTAQMLGYLHMVCISPYAKGGLYGIVSLCFEPLFTYCVKLSEEMYGLDRVKVCLVPREGKEVWI